MTLLDLLGDLVLLGSVLFTLVAVVRVAVLALAGRGQRAARALRGLGVFLACYAAMLVAVAVLTPRRMLAVGERECFDDWCAAGGVARPAPAGDAPCAATAGTRAWVATIEVSSDAKRVRQRALDAYALLETREGAEYAACAEPLTRHALPDEIGPGEAFDVVEPFLLPPGAEPAGVIVSHGGFPDLLVIGADQSLLHKRTLLRVATQGE